MSRTSAELIDSALTYVGATGTGQISSAGDVALATRYLEPLVAELAALEIVALIIVSGGGVFDVIPDELFSALTRLLANDLAPHFGVAAASEAEREGMLQRLRRIVAVGSADTIMEACYF
jgi:hypothetical protein